MDRELEKLIWDRAEGHCEYCRLPTLEWLRFQFDHIIAEKHHGPTEKDNLALSCFHCNSFKGPNISGVDPLTGKLTRLFHPRRDAWDKHFEWNGVLLVGRSPIGRTTIAGGTACFKLCAKHRKLGDSVPLRKRSSTL